MWYDVEFLNLVKHSCGTLVQKHFCCADFLCPSILYSEAIIDPAAIFAMLFGSELFEEYIGQLAMASMASMDIFTEGEQFDTKKLQEKMRV